MTRLKRLTIALFALCLCASAVEGDEKLFNGHFKQEMQNWEYAHAQEYRGKIEPPKFIQEKPLPVFLLDVPHRSRHYYIRISQEIELREAGVYEISFELKGESTESIVSTYVNNEASPRVLHGLMQRVNLTADWKRHVFRFKARDLDSSLPPHFRIGFGESEGEVFLRNVSMRELADDTTIQHQKYGANITPAAPATKATAAAATPATADMSTPAILQIAVMHQEFSSDAKVALASYRKKTLKFAGKVEAVTPGKQKGTHFLRLDGKKALILTRANTIPPNVLRKLKETLAAGDAPSIEGIARFYGFRNNAIQFVDGHKLRFEK